MEVALIDIDFYIRVRRFNGYSASGKVKYHKRKSVRAKRLVEMFGQDKVEWWYEKAIKLNKPFRATKKEHYVIDFYRRYAD